MGSLRKVMMYIAEYYRLSSSECATLDSGSPATDSVASPIDRRTVNPTSFADLYEKLHEVKMNQEYNEYLRWRG